MKRLAGKVLSVEQKYRSAAVRQAQYGDWWRGTRLLRGLRPPVRATLATALRQPRTWRRR